MNRLGVLKDVAYAAKTGGGTVVDYKEIKELAQGAIAFFNPKGELLVNTAGVVNGLPDAKTFTIAVGRVDDVQVINGIPRKSITEINKALYRAFTKPVVTVGPLTFTDGEEISISVTDSSYTNRYAIRSKKASVYYKTGITESVAADQLVERLNSGNSFITAAKTGSGPYNITITPKEDGVSIDTVLRGSAEYDGNSVTTPSVYGIGGGTAVLAMEKDFSVEEGNGNYRDLTDEFYKREFEALTSVNYDLTTLVWEGTHASPTASHNVMHNRVVIANVNGGTAQLATDIQVIIAALVGEAYTADEGAETGTDDGTENDGVAGN